MADKDDEKKVVGEFYWGPTFDWSSRFAASYKVRQKIPGTISVKKKSKDDASGEEKVEVVPIEQPTEILKIPDSVTVYDPLIEAVSDRIYSTVRATRYVLFDDIGPDILNEGGIAATKLPKNEYLPEYIAYDADNTGRLYGDFADLQKPESDIFIYQTCPLGAIKYDNESWHDWDVFFKIKGDRAHLAFTRDWGDFYNINVHDLGTLTTAYATVLSLRWREYMREFYLVSNPSISYTFTDLLNVRFGTDDTTKKLVRKYAGYFDSKDVEYKEYTNDDGDVTGVAAAKKEKDYHVGAVADGYAYYNKNLLSRSYMTQLYSNAYFTHYYKCIPTESHVPDYSAHFNYFHCTTDGSSYYRFPSVTIEGLKQDEKFLYGLYSNQNICNRVTDSYEIEESIGYKRFITYLGDDDPVKLLPYEEKRDFFLDKIRVDSVSEGPYFVSFLSFAQPDLSLTGRKFVVFDKDQFKNYIFHTFIRTYRKVEDIDDSVDAASKFVSLGIVSSRDTPELKLTGNAYRIASVYELHLNGKTYLLEKCFDNRTFNGVSAHTGGAVGAYYSVIKDGYEDLLGAELLDGKFLFIQTDKGKHNSMYVCNPRKKIPKPVRDDFEEGEDGDNAFEEALAACKRPLRCFRINRLTNDPDGRQYELEYIVNEDSEDESEKNYVVYIGQQAVENTIDSGKIELKTYFEDYFSNHSALGAMSSLQFKDNAKRRFQLTFGTSRAQQDLFYSGFFYVNNLLQKYKNFKVTPRFDKYWGPIVGTNFYHVGGVEGSYVTDIDDSNRTTFNNYLNHNLEGCYIPRKFPEEGLPLSCFYGLNNRIDYKIYTDGSPCSYGAISDNTTGYSYILDKGLGDPGATVFVDKIIEAIGGQLAGSKKCVVSNGLFPVSMYDRPYADGRTTVARVATYYTVTDTFEDDDGVETNIERYLYAGWPKADWTDKIGEDRNPVYSRVYTDYYEAFPTKITYTEPEDGSDSKKVVEIQKDSNWEYEENDLAVPPLSLDDYIIKWNRLLSVDGYYEKKIGVYTTKIKTYWYIDSRGVKKYSIEPEPWDFKGQKGKDWDVNGEMHVTYFKKCSPVYKRADDTATLNLFEDTPAGRYMFEDATALWWETARPQCQHKKSPDVKYLCTLFSRYRRANQSDAYLTDNDGNTFLDDEFEVVGRFPVRRDPSDVYSSSVFDRLYECDFIRKVRFSSVPYVSAKALCSLSDKVAKEIVEALEVEYDAKFTYSFLYLRSILDNDGERTKPCVILCKSSDEKQSTSTKLEIYGYDCVAKIEQSDDGEFFFVWGGKAYRLTPRIFGSKAVIADQYGNSTWTAKNSDFYKKTGGFTFNEVNLVLKGFPTENSYQGCVEVYLNAKNKKNFAEATEDSDGVGYELAVSPFSITGNTYPVNISGFFGFTTAPMVLQKVVVSSRPYIGPYIFSPQVGDLTLVKNPLFFEGKFKDIPKKLREINERLSKAESYLKIYGGYIEGAEELGSYESICAHPLSAYVFSKTFDRLVKFVYKSCFKLKKEVENADDLVSYMDDRWWDVGFGPVPSPGPEDYDEWKRGFIKSHYTDRWAYISGYNANYQSVACKVVPDTEFFDSKASELAELVVLTGYGEEITPSLLSEYSHKLDVAIKLLDEMSGRKYYVQGKPPEQYKAYEKVTAMEKYRKKDPNNGDDAVDENGNPVYGWRVKKTARTSLGPVADKIKHVYVVYHDCVGVKYRAWHSYDMVKQTCINPSDYEIKADRYPDMPASGDQFEWVDSEEWPPPEVKVLAPNYHGDVFYYDDHIYCGEGDLVAYTDIYDVTEAMQEALAKEEKPNEA